MKFTRVMSIVLISLTVIGWGVFIISPNGNNGRLVEQHCTEAEDLINRGLYKLAIDEYNAALEIDPKNEEVWAYKLYAYKYLYEEGKDVYSDYLDDLTLSVDLFPKNVDFVLAAANLYIDEEEYDSAYKMLTKAVDAGVTDETVLSLYFETKYAFKTNYSEYKAVKEMVNNYFAVMNEAWEYLDSEGNKSEIGNASFAGPVGEDTIRLMTDAKTAKTYLIDDETTIHGYFSETPEEAGVYSEGLIAIKHDGKYYYYNS